MKAVPSLLPATAGAGRWAVPPRLRGGVPMGLLGWLSAAALGVFVLSQHRVESHLPAALLTPDEVASIALISVLLGVVATLAALRWHAGRRRSAREAAQRLQSSQAAARDARDQVLRELHDGLGGHLASALSLTEQAAAHEGARDALQRLQSTLDESLAELRLSIDLLAQHEHVVSQALGELRERVESSLRAAGIELVWDLRDDRMRLAAPETVQLLRLVRAALGASLWPARAVRRVQLSLERVETDTGARLVLGLFDDGRDVELLDATEAEPLARRLADLQRRATALGAQTWIGAHADGWGVELALPLPAAPPALR